MRSAAVIGTGAIGTSVALALARHGVTVYLDDVNRTAARTAEAMGAGSLAAPDGPVDLAVLAVPPAHVGTVLARSQRVGLAHAYTDVASVKAQPHDEIDRAGADPASYIGGHPMAGTERSGPLAGRADLFEGRPWVLTPSPCTGQETLNRALELASLCGGTPVVMDAAAHDRAVALVSHAPHLVSSLLAARLAGAGEESIRISGQGLRDVTRIAAGDPGLWNEILDANATAVADVLDAYAADLGRAIGALRALGGADAVRRRAAASTLDGLLRTGNEGRARVAHKSGTPLTDLTAVPVLVPDQPGALARLFTAVGEIGVNIEDVRIEHSMDRPRGLVELLVQQRSAPALSRLLDAGGWTVAENAVAEHAVMAAVG
ncbi:prephenate dehydrogenase [Kitasatospora sp. CM 4170]|uniref:Prephenate dehydrogenase n=1 Tax=Kitasatospora aburaviensis TaxID=67265 RepID=A0ABW1EVH6_9ACTN|nr:prephenate dehydrogenase [Kitasatospora sp. CM 4170]WNM44773.1 prephenate dehydrogenase [Kitasatospora sp. CM 4170]